MKHWPVLLLLALVATACDGPLPSAPDASRPAPSDTGAPESAAPPSGAGAPATASPTSNASTACRLVTQPVALPASLADLHGHVDGVSPTGEVLILQSHTGYVGDTLVAWDPATGETSAIVSRTPAKTPESATSQVSTSAGNGEWIVWQESGFALVVADWVVWAERRSDATIHKVASHKPDANGQIAPGWASDMSVAGDVAAWSAPVLIDGRPTPRIYVAGLRGGEPSRLEQEAQWPSLIGSGRLVAAVRTGAAGGHVLSQPQVIDLATGTATPVDGFEPGRYVAVAASATGTIATRLLAEATSDSEATAEAVIAQAGSMRTIPLPVDWGPVAAGDGFVAWMDQLHLWILPAGATEPTMLAQVADTLGNLRMRVAGRWIYWHTDPLDDGTTGVDILGSVACPAGQ